MIARDSLCALALTVAPCLAQRTWIVDQAGGPGVQFTDIPPAIAAAGPGDRIEVRGTYTYSTFSLTRGIDVEATQGATVPEVWIENVPAAETAMVAGFRVGAPGILFPGWPPVRLGGVGVLSCGGRVVLSSLTVTVGDYISRLLAYPPGGVHVEGTNAVLITSCRVTGGNGLAVIASQILVQRTSLQAAAGQDSPGGVWGGSDGGSAIILQNSVLVAAGVTAVAGPGGRGSPNCNQAGTGGDAVRGDGGLFLAGSVLVRGLGGYSPCRPSVPGQAIQGRSRVTTDCSVTGGITGGGGFVPAWPWLASPGQLTLGSPATLTCHGAPSALFVLLLDTRFAVTPIAGVDTVFSLTPGFFVGSVVMIAATGQASHGFTLPNDPTWRDRFLFFQAIALQPSGPSVALTNIGDFRMR